MTRDPASHFRAGGVALLNPVPRWWGCWLDRLLPCAIAISACASDPTAPVPLGYGTEIRYQERREIEGAFGRDELIQAHLVRRQLGPVPRTEAMVRVRPGVPDALEDHVAESNE